jgi:hypothetical protein
MEKEKRKNNQPPFFKTPVGSCCFSIVMLVIVVTVLSPVIVVVGTISLVYLDNWRHGQFVKANLALVQEEIRSQCQLSDYVAVGRFDDSSGFPPPYYHFTTGADLQISCNLEDKEWQCTCIEEN